MLKSVKGHVVYLPLPVDEHRAMIPSGLAENHELHILVNGRPTKSNVIWQDVVKIEKIKQALDDLSRINPLYENLKDDEFDRYRASVCNGTSNEDGETVTGPDEFEDIGAGGGTEPDASTVVDNEDKGEENHNKFQINPG